MSYLPFFIFFVVVNAFVFVGGYFLGLGRRRKYRRAIRVLMREAEMGRQLAVRVAAAQEEIRIIKGKARSTERQLAVTRRDLLDAHQEVNAALQSAASRRQIEHYSFDGATQVMARRPDFAPALSQDFEGAVKQVTLAYGHPDVARILGKGPDSGEPLPFKECLSLAVQALWSGRIEVLDAQEQAQGEVVFAQGMIAWAVCKTQRENLGTFLFRLGRVSREDLQRVRDLYQRHQGKRKLGAILEEQGLIHPPVLRRCLMLHARKALSLLLTDEQGKGRCSQRAMPEDERHLFFPEEVLPLSVLADLVNSSPAHQAQAQKWKELGKDNDVLAPLAALADYRASAIVTWEGQVVTAHLDPDRVNPYLLSVLVAGLVEASNRAAFQGNIGQFETLTLECSEGCLVARWIDEDLSFLGLVLLNSSAHSPAAKAALHGGAPAVREWLEKRGHVSGVAVEAGSAHT